MLKYEVIGFVAAKDVMVLGVDAAVLDYRPVLHRLQGVCNAAVICSRYEKRWSEKLRVGF